jgi:L-asparagine oxygenase
MAVTAAPRGSTPRAVDAPDFRLPVPAGRPSDGALVAVAADAAHLLPESVHDALVAFVADSGAGTLLLRAMPVGEVPATPVRPGARGGTDQTSELTLLTVACLLGEPIGYVQEHGGGLVQDIVPAPHCASRQVSTSSAVTLAWHTETAFHPHKPRFVLLLCLRGDPAATTLLCSIVDVLPFLDAQTVAVLGQPRFRTRPDESFLAHGSTSELGPPMPVLDGNRFTYDEDLMVGIDDEAQAALDQLGSVVRSQATALVLEAGDLLVIDNERVVHGRSPFRARFDGTDRWIQRAFVVDDLDASAGERDGRIITTPF